ncbi:hypothetical protein [Mycoplasma putrefaciens]|uniref:hypothetical protein n=1 Tax=Mycoplasma putrefaciens TaxID=2123 RepID=UPI0011B4A2DB|nr:hypothetical protein [Mycoplasma putrefaciens]
MIILIGLIIFLVKSKNHSSQLPTNNFSYELIEKDFKNTNKKIEDEFSNKMLYESKEKKR